MSLEAWLGIAAILTTLIIAVGGFLIRHAIKDAQNIGEVRTEIANIKQQIGTRETGLTGSVHKHGNIISRLHGVMLFIAEKLKITVRKEFDE